jgi:hypothetical protein
MLQKHRGPQLFEAPVEARELEVSEKLLYKGEELNFAAKAELSSAQTFSGAQRFSGSELASDAGELEIDFELNNDFYAQITEPTLVKNPTNVVPGQRGFISLMQSEEEGYDIVFESSFWFVAGQECVVSTVPGSLTVISYEIVSPTQIVCFMKTNCLPWQDCYDILFPPDEGE